MCALKAFLVYLVYFSLFLFASYFQKFLTLLYTKGHHFKKYISKKEAAGHKWLLMSEQHSKDIESIGAAC